MKKYVLLPGYIVSKSDGDEHFISGQQLIDLYGFNKDNVDDCVILMPSERFLLPRYRREGYTILEPRYSGDYSLPN